MASPVNGNPSLMFRRSPWKHLGLLLVSFLMVATAYFSATRAPDLIHRGAGWFGMFFSALGIVAALRDHSDGGSLPLS